MKRRLFLQGVGLMAAATAGPAKLLACVTCHDFATNDDGYKSSVIDCSAPMNCFRVLKPAEKGYLDTLHPGFFLKREPGSFRVSEALSYSPASRQDAVRRGDRILRINGFTTKFYSEDYGWDAGGANRGSCLLEIERTGDVKQVRVALRTVRSLLNEAWSTRYSGQRPIQGMNWIPAPELGGIEGAYTAGINWWPRDNFLEISDVLVGSPAHRSGIQVGDRITLIEGRPVVATESEKLLPGPKPTMVRIEVERQDERRVAAIEKIGLSTLLYSIAQMEKSEAVPSSIEL